MFAPSSIWRGHVRSMLVMVVALVVLGLGVSAGPADATAPEVESRAPYLGRWNYDQPDQDSLVNIGVLRCPAGDASCVEPGPNDGPLEVPQIGDIVLSEGPGGSVTGRTDVGCTWRFAPSPDNRSLQLTPAPQYCFNEVSGVGYTITRWSLTLRGNHQREVITAVSHRPNGGAYDFTVENGRRTRAPEPGRPGAERPFVGTWEYTAADPEAQVNVIQAREVGPDGERLITSEQAGLVTITAAGDGTVVARTADGCRWSLVARGNTASLAPEGQTCTVGGSTVTMANWAIASDGRHQVSRLRGVTEAGATTTSFLLLIGDLTKARVPATGVRGG